MQVTFVDAQKISLAFIKSPLGVAKFSDEFGGSDDGVLKGYLMLYAKTALREFAEVVEARHGVRAMSLFLEKQGKLAEFEKWSSAEHKRRQEAYELECKKKREQTAASQATRDDAAYASIRRRLEQEEAVGQMVIAMPSDGGSTASYDGSWNENYYPSNGYYYSGAAYRAAARNRVSDRMQNWRPRATPAFEDRVRI